MRFLIGGALFDVTWRYSAVMHELYDYATTCIISKKIGNGVKDWEPIVEANTLCAREDKFVKDIGRRISLTRALQKSDFTKKDRAFIWHNYFNRS